MIALGLALAVVSAVAINGGYALQHASASVLPPLSLRQPLRSIVSLFRSGRWSFGFFAGVGGWVFYVIALRIAPLSLVQAASAGGIGVLAIGGGRLRPAERIGIGAALTGLLLLGLSVGSHPGTGRGSATAIGGWMLVSLGVAAGAAKIVPGGAGLGTAAGVLYAAGDVGTKAAVMGGTRLLFVPTLLACHTLAFVCMQLAFQRGGRLSTAGLAVLWMNALPILAGTVLYAEALPDGWRGVARVAAFVFVLAGAVALSKREPTALDRSAPLPEPAPLTVAGAPLESLID